MAPLRIMLVLLLAFASSTQPCRAQLFGYCGPKEAESVYVTCQAHLTTPAVTRPDLNCCLNLDTHNRYYGASCYCDIYSLWQADPVTLGIDMERAYALPKACDMMAAVNMTNCAPPNVVAPSSPPRLSPPPPLLVPSPPAVRAPAPGFPFPPPPDAVAPPGSTSVPGLAPGRSAPAPTVSTSESSGKSSSTPLALPLGIPGGAVGLVVLVLAIFRIRLIWNMNAPCWCCHRRPRPQPQV